MTDTIICTPIRQPSAFSNNSTGFSVAAVLNFDCRLVPHETPQTDPESRFRTFLHALPNATFRVYQLPDPLPPQPHPSGTWPFEPADWTVSWNVPSGATPVDNVLRWLERRGVDPNHPANPVPPDYWQPPSTNTNTTLKLVDLKATHFLGSATAWPAPLPQDAGLVRVVTLTPTTDPPKDQRLVIIPFFDGASPNFEPKNFSQNNGIINFTYDAGTDFPDGALAEIRLIEDNLPDVTSLVDTSSGFLLAPADTLAAQDADRIAAILQRIENRSASLFWALPPIQSVTWPSGDPENIQRLVWRAMSGLAALLDPVLMSLILPPPNTNTADQKGPFVAALAVCVDRVVADQGTSVLTDGIAQYIKNGLNHKLVLVDESNGQQRADLVDLLAGLFKIDISKQDIATATGILPLLLLAYRKDAPDQLTKPGWFDDPKNPRFKPYEATLSNEFGALAQKLQTEDGIESYVLALFNEIGLFDKSGQTGGALAQSPCTVPAIGDDAAKTAIASFSALLNQNFNGLDAARHAVARLLELHLVAAASTNQPGGWTADDLADAVTGARWFARRIDTRIHGGLDEFAKALPLYAEKALSVGDRAKLVDMTQTPPAGMLDTAFERVSDEVLATGAARRFLPDSAPGKLRIQIAVDSDATDFENFVHTYNGIGVLVRRAGDAKWAYGNLAELCLYNMYDGKDHYRPVLDPQHPEHSLITMLPLQPAAIDGQCRLFLEFDGHPFTDRTFAGTSAAGNASDANQAPFYLFHAPSKDDLSAASFALTPALAYGKAYEAAAFVVGKGGSLPLGAQTSTPWLPVNAPQVPTSTGKAYSRSFLYQRTTAIGHTSLNELAQPGIAKRIGVGIDGVQPLFRDHPRAGLSSVNGPAVLDVLRNADGTGAFGLPEPGETVSISLEDVWWWGSDGKLTLSFFNQPGPRPENAAGRTSDDDPLVDPIEIPVAASVADATLQIQITSEPDSAQAHHVILTFAVLFPGTTVSPVSKSVSDSIKSIWTRLKIAASDSAKTASLSFSDPTANLAGSYVTSHPTTNSLLLIAPNSTSEWRAPFTREVTADIILPRVGFVDLDRWLWNDSLFSDAATPDRTRPPTQPELDSLSDFYKNTLMAAYIQRHADQNLPPLLERLPDLAVDQLLVELTPLDALFDDPGNVTSSPPYPNPTTKMSQVINLRTLGKRLLAKPVQTSTDLDSKLLNLSDGCSASLQIVSDDSGVLSIAADFTSDERDAAIKVTVPRGTVARLTIRPMVPKGYLEGARSIFDAGMATLATEIRDDHYIFEGTSLVIESMLGALASRSPAAWQDQLQADKRCYDWEDLVATAVTVRPAGAHRSYDLIARPAAIETETHAWRWRQLANIDVSTQRWRFSGRPIYSWLAPSDGRSFDVAIEQKWDNGGANRDDIIAFETESFFDRDDADADSQTMRLNPAGDTVLQSFPWEQPSATYFRHRLTIRSRYEGALASGQVAAQPVWGEDTDTDGKGLKSAARSWIRVAMLADRTRLQLTRPQLRALIPLTSAPDNGVGALAAAPPVMAILDERPFAHGGLADRIAAEIRTGLGYVLPPAPQTLQILDSRKEFGPDPRLTYTPTPKEVAPAMTLREEGPLGLTFDSESVRNPLFVNTALILHPVLMIGNGAGAGTLEEHFLSVGLRRYLDTSWLVGGTSPTTTQAIAEPLWIGPVNDPTFTLGADTAPHPLITLSNDHGVWIVKFDSTQIDTPPPVKGAPPPMPQPAPSDPYKILCKVDSNLTDALAFLHSPLEKGRASLSVFALPSGNIGDSAVLAGAGNQPLMMASLEWQVAAGAANLTFGGTSPQLRLTSASPTTLMNWTRTGKNFDVLHTNDPSLLLNASDVGVQKTTNGYRFVRLTDRKVLTLAPERIRYPNPLNVHRHHAVIATSHAPGIGKPIEVYQKAFRFFGGSLSSLDDDAQAVRVIEFETPARPFAWLTPSSMEAYKTVSFDLFSVLGNPPPPAQGSPPAIPGFSFFIRVLGGDATNSTLTEWTVQATFTKRDGTTLPPTSVTITNPSPPRLVRGLLLNAAVVSGKPIAFSCQIVYDDGDTSAAPLAVAQPITAGLADVLSVLLTGSGIKTNRAQPPELWADVSLLTLPSRPADGDFTYDWFFTGGEVPLPADAVTATALLDTVEAQARIISVSPPIQIVGS